MKQPETVLGVFQLQWHIYLNVENMPMRLKVTLTSLTLFQAVSVFCFSFISECATRFSRFLFWFSLSCFRIHSFKQSKALV